MAERMSEDQLRAITDGEMRQAIGFWGGKLAAQRQKAMYYYYGEAVGDLSPPEVEGRSTVVSPDVRNTIESMLPQLMVKFAGTDHPVEFEATKPGEEQKAEQATDYCSYIYNVKNPGERITYSWMKDALLSKNGFVKVWWDTRAEEKREEYEGLSDIELAQLMDDEEVELTEQKSYPDEEDAEQRQEALAKLEQAFAQTNNPQIQAQIAQISMAPPKMLYDVVCKRVMTGGRLRVDNVPPEEFLISRKAKSIEDASFVGHRVARTKSELKSMGYKNVDQLGSDDASVAMNMERIQRLSFDDEMAAINPDAGTNLDDSQATIWVTECYVRVDFDGDGIAELRKVVRAGNQILENEVVDCAPFVSITPVPLPHKFFGLSVADLAMTTQKVNTGLLRGVLDNTWLQINGRYFAVEGKVNLDDLLISRPGGVVRVKDPSAAGRLDQGAGNAEMGMSMLEFMKGFNEDSTGWTRYNQGSDGDSLNQTATGVMQISNRADMRLDLIARNFAEGFRELFRMILKLCSQYQQKEVIAKLRGQWVPCNPREWRNGFEATINVGLGTGNKNQLVAQLMALSQQQANGLQIGTATPENVYNAQVEIAKAMGFKSGDKFFTDPSKMPPKQQPPTPEQIKAQTALQIKQMELQADAQKFQATWTLDTKRAAMDHEAAIQAKQAELQVQAANDARDAERERARIEMDTALKAQQAQFDAWKAQLEAETRIVVAQIGAEARNQEPDGDDESMQQLLSHMNAPREVVRDQNGKAVGVRVVMDGAPVMDTKSLLASLKAPREIVRDEKGRAVGSRVASMQ